MVRKHPIRLFQFLFVFFATSLALRGQQYNPPDTRDEYEKQYQERIKKDRLYGIYIPRNLDDALAQLDKLTSPEAKKVFMSIPEDSVCRIMHNRLGQWMIVNWSFYEGSRLSHYLRSAGVTYPDDMADFLILAFHQHVHGKPVVIKDLAVYFREKRKTEWQKEVKEGQIIKEEVRQRPKPEPSASPADTLPAPAKPAAGPAKTTTKGGSAKQ